MEPPIHPLEGAESVPDPAVDAAPVWSATPIPDGTAATTPLSPAAAWAAEVAYGGFWRRTGAYFLDAFFISIISLPSTVLTLTAYGSLAATLVSIVTVVIVIGYLPFCWSRSGMTVGNALMGLRVVGVERMQRIRWWRAIGRLFAFYPAIIPFGLGVMWVGWEPRKRGWHDRLADTLVIRVPSLAERHDPRRKWAIAAVLIGSASWVFSIVVGITIGLAVATHGFRDAHGQLVGSQVLALDALRPGDCFDPFITNFQTVTATPCSELHTYEVFATFKVRGSVLPSPAQLQQLANDWCINGFNDYVGTPYEQSTMYVGYTGPDAGTWLLGRQTLTCFLANAAQTKVRGSARKSGL